MNHVGFMVNHKLSVFCGKLWLIDLMSTILIKNASVIATCNDKKEVIYDKSILISDNLIADVGDISEDIKADITIDGRGRVVLPGFVNTHHHLYQVLTRNIPQVQSAKLFDWLKFLYRIWQNVDDEAIEVSTKAGTAELLLTGCTTTSDHLYVFPGSSSNTLIDTEIAAARQVGIRFHPTRGSMSLGESSGGLPPDEVIQSDEEILKESERIITEYHDPGDMSMLRIVLAPCSPFSVTESIMRDTADLARSRDVFMHTHLAETKDEELFCIESKGMRPLEYMETVGWLGRDVWFAHCVYMEEDEIKRLAETQSGVAHCPTSNLRLGSGIAPIRKMLDNNVNVSIAVDGSASNDSSDMLGEIRMAMLVARYLSGVDSMDAGDVIYMATRGGAKVLGRDDIGVIEKGKAADISIFNTQRIDFAGSGSDMLASIVFCGASHFAETVIVNGVIRVSEGRVTSIDTDDILEKANRVSKQLIEKA